MQASSWSVRIWIQKLALGERMKRGTQTVVHLSDMEITPAFQTTKKFFFCFVLFKNENLGKDSSKKVV